MAAMTLSFNTWFDLLQQKAVRPVRVGQYIHHESLAHLSQTARLLPLVTGALYLSLRTVRFGFEEGALYTLVLQDPVPGNRTEGYERMAMHGAMPGRPIEAKQAL